MYVLVLLEFYENLHHFLCNYRHWVRIEEQKVNCYHH
jgi:hypothetical protein